MDFLFGVIIGIALGLTGGGGSIFGVPLLIYGLGLEPKSAIVTSLAAVAVTAAVGAAESIRHGVVEMRAALLVAVAGMAAAPLGVAIGGWVSETVALACFAVLMIVVALRMAATALRSPSESANTEAGFAAAAQEPGAMCHYAPDGRLRFNTACSAALLAAGGVVGVLSGFLGVGGGFLIVPALIVVTEMGMHRAVATSLLVVALVGLSGLASSVVSGREIDWVVTGLFTAGGICGMFVGRGLARHLPGATLQRVFAGAMLATALFLIVENLPKLL